MTTTTRSIADLPGAPGRLPLIGNAHQLVPHKASLHTPLERWARQTPGSMYRIDLGPKRSMVAISDHDLVNDVLRRRPEEFRRAGGLADLMGELFGGSTGLFLVEGAEWRHQRNFVMAALNTKYLKTYFEVINRTGQRMHTRLHAAAAKGEAINVGREFNLYAVDVATGLAFGQDLNSVGRGENEFQRLYGRVLDRVVSRLFTPVPYWRYVQLPVDRRAARDAEKIVASLRDFLAQARLRFVDNPGLRENPETVLDALIVEQETDNRFTDEEILGNMSTLLFAGQDSIAQTLAWTFWLIGQNPRVQAKLAEEAQEVLGDVAFPNDLDTSSRLTYTDAVLRESMRLRTVSPVFVADAVVDTTIGDLFVPKGTELALLGRIAAEYRGPDADEFRPERWLEDGHKDIPKTLTFGSGPRYCPGRNLALAEARAAVAMVSRDFELRLDPTAPPIRESLNFAMSPGEVRMFITPRTRVTREQAAPVA